MPCSVARACQENGNGHVIFIDPSYDGGSHPGWGGGDFWSDPVQVKERWDFYSLTGWITHLKMTSEQAFPHVKAMVGEGKLGVVVIDGAHTYENSLQDFDLYTSLMTEGYAVFHDAVSSWCDVPKTIHTIRTRGYHLITMHREVGLAIVEIWNPPNVKNTWGYLCKPSNRGKLLLKEAGSRIRPGDRVLDVYCGYSPLGFELKDQKVFGCDRDPAIIKDLKVALPQHQWAQIEEHYLPFAALPEEIDVVVGLGVSRGHAWWDPQRVVENVRYLLGRYFPRTCIFETAAGYYGADILYDLQFILMKLGYVCEHVIISTDMDNFSRRAVLIADRPTK
jgi:hypothetical protein